MGPASGSAWEGAAGPGAREHAEYSLHGKASETGRGYSHHLDNHERDVCGKMLIDACTRARMLAAMEEVFPVCDRSSPRSFFKHVADDCISITLIRNSLHSLRGGQKNKVETLLRHSRRINAFCHRLACLLYLADSPSRGPAPQRILSFPITLE